jgi:hypothetical protein
VRPLAGEPAPPRPHARSACPPQFAPLRRLGFSFCGSGRSLRLRDRRQPLYKLDKLSRRPVRRRTGCRELFLVSLPCRSFAGQVGDGPISALPFGNKLALEQLDLALPSRPFAGKFGRQPFEVGLQGGDVCFTNRLRRDTEPNSGLGVGHPFPIHSRPPVRGALPVQRHSGGMVDGRLSGGVRVRIVDANRGSESAGQL